MFEYLNVLQQIAEQKINEAMQEGLFDNLPGKGKPLVLDDDSHIPPDQRIAYRILKNAGYTSPEVEERKEITNIRDMLENCSDEQTCYRQVQKLNMLVTKINESRRTPVYLEASQVYYEKVVQRVKINKQTPKKDKL